MTNLIKALNQKNKLNCRHLSICIHNRFEKTTKYKFKFKTLCLICRSLWLCIAARLPNGNISWGIPSRSAGWVFVTFLDGSWNWLEQISLVWTAMPLGNSCIIFSWLDILFSIQTFFIIASFQTAAANSWKDLKNFFLKVHLL